MAGALIASAVTPHTPRMGIEEQAPAFVRGLIEGSRELGAALRALKPDLIVLQSAHWVATFNWYVTAHERHEGTCVADEAPDLIPGLPYRYPGDPEFARALAESIRALELPCGLNESPHYRWDYGTLVPLRYPTRKPRCPSSRFPWCSVPASMNAWPWAEPFTRPPSAPATGWCLSAAAPFPTR